MMPNRRLLSLSCTASQSGGPAAAGVRLNDPLGSGKNIFDFRISPDSSRVVYISDQQTATVLELYSVPIGGPAAARIKLNGALALNGNVTAIQISPDSRRVVYNADQQTDQVFELYSVPITGPAAAGVKLNGPLSPGGVVVAGSARIAVRWFITPPNLRIMSLGFTVSPSRVRRRMRSKSHPPWSRSMGDGGKSVRREAGWFISGTNR